MTHKKLTNRFYPIPGFPGYFINKTTTEVLCTNEPLPVILDQVPNSTKDPYFIVTLSDNKNHFIHRLMAKTFLSGPEKPHVNHIDGNKQNNNLSNLEWATPAENTQHAHSTGLITPYTKEVHQYSLGGLYIASYTSDVEATKTTGVAKQNISKCTLRQREHAGGFQWSRSKTSSVPPVKVTLLKGAEILDTKTNEISFIPLKGQDFFGPISKQLGIAKHILQRRFDNNVAFVNHYRIEKIFFD